MAVDSAVMVIDSAKGIEAQTKKLFQVVKTWYSILLLLTNWTVTDGNHWNF